MGYAIPQCRLHPPRKRADMNLLKKLVATVMTFALWQQLAWAATADQHQAEYEQAASAAFKVMQAGPSAVKLTDQGTLNLPAGFSFIPQPEAASLMRAMGNTPDERLLGLVFPEDGGTWFATLKFDKAGYIKDDDAKEWNADELLTSIKEGTDAANEERKQRGFPELEILGWVEKPTYAASAHHLLWSIATKDKGASDNAEQGVNYNTYILGREGYLTLDMITDRNLIDGLKPTASKLLSAMTFETGKRYEDFNDTTDKVAEYGLAALVTGIAVKKLGLLAMAGVFFAKFAKLILLAVFGGFAAFKKFFKREKA